MLLRRLRDPGTSTRRTPAARERLVSHPMTTALLDAGVRLLLAELEPPAATTADPRHPPALFFGCLSAARVCAAATRVGPLRVTAAHLRDRWPRQDDFVDDVLSYSLWFEHHFAGAIAQAARLPQELPEGASLDEAVAVLVRSELHTLAEPVTSRMEVLSCALAASQPWLREVQRRNYAVYDAAWDTALNGVLRRCGRRLRDGVPAADLARAVGGLGEGVSLRLLAHGERPQEQRAADADFARGVGALLRSWTVPVGTGGEGEDDDERAPGPALPAPPPRTHVADVLPRLGDPASGTRTTAGARRRLAEDRITAQLLDGALVVLAEEFGVDAGSVCGPTCAGCWSPAPDAVPRFFASVSAARVVAEARRAGHSATDAQLRDRWALQEHYVDDLVGYALEQVGLLYRTAGTASGGPSSPEDLERDESEVHGRLRSPDGSADFRLRLLLTTTATRTSIVDDFVEQHRLADTAVLAHAEGVLAATGRRWADGVVPLDAARTILAVTHGEIMRVLATGQDDVRGDQPALARGTTAVLTALLAP